MLIFGPMSGLLARRFGPKLPMFLGAVFVVAAFALPAMAHDQLWHIVVSGLLTGAGIGLAFAAMSNAIIETVPASHTGEATSVNAIVRTIGGSVGTAVVAAVVASNVSARGVPTNHAFTEGFWVCAAVAVIAVGAAMALPSARRRRQEAVDAGVEDLPAEPQELHLPHR
jgi:MFS family permease